MHGTSPRQYTLIGPLEGKARQLALASQAFRILLGELTAAMILDSDDTYVTVTEAANLAPDPVGATNAHQALSASVISLGMMAMGMSDKLHWLVLRSGHEEESKLSKIWQWTLAQNERRRAEKSDRRYAGDSVLTNVLPSAAGQRASSSEPGEHGSGGFSGFRAAALAKVSELYQRVHTQQVKLLFVHHSIYL